MPPIGLELHDLSWRTARRSAGNGACVEVATARRHVLVRDSKDQHGPVVQYPSGAWQTFLANARKGQFDL